MSKPGRLWFPLDVGFWDDPDIIAIGDAAAIMLQRLIGYAKKHQTDGEIPMRVVREVGGRWWQKHFRRLVDRGLVAAATDERRTNDGQTGDGLTDACPSHVCQIVAYLSWNDSSDKIEQRRKIAAEKKRQQREARGDVPKGQGGSVPGHRAEVEKEQRVIASPNGEAPSKSPDATPPSVPLSAQIQDLEARYPSGICAEAREAVALSRRNGKVADSVWLTTLRKLDGLPEAASTHAMRIFVERHADGDKGEAYLVAIARREAKGGPGPARDRRNGMIPTSPPSSFRPDGATDEELDAFFGPRKPQEAARA